jgi:sulfate transport system ATP-binding protein
MDIHVRDLGKTFGVSPTLHGIDIDIASGELLGLLGPSGSGKTTLLRTIAGLETPTRGEIYFGDERASQKSVQDRRVGFVFQSYALFKHMTVADNIGYGLRIRPRATRPTRVQIARRVADLLDMMQMAGFGGRYPAQLSGGQRQRVALARALAVEPRVLLLDEPFGALDAQVRKDLRSWLREIHDRTGHTTVFVTHDQDEALELSDRVAILNRGRIEQLGTPDEVYDRPQTPFVFGFIGESNRLPVQISGGRVLFEGTQLDVPPPALTDGPGVLFFRPQHAQIGAPGTAVPAVVRDIHRIGPQTRARLLLSHTQAPVEVNVPDRTILRPGDGLGITMACTFSVDRAAA